MNAMSLCIGNFIYENFRNTKIRYLNYLSIFESKNQGNNLTSQQSNDRNIFKIVKV